MLWLPEDIEKALNTKLSCDASFPIQSVSIDTRTLKPSSLFVALKGDAFDGHDFLKDAINKGASCALVSNTDLVRQYPQFPFFFVDDTLRAFHTLAKASRERFKGKVIGITGSVGKTTLKEMLAHVLTQFGLTYYSPSSFNNHWGVPYTLCNLPSDFDFAVLEIGTNHLGEIQPLAHLVQPHIALIGLIAEAHVGYFESKQDIAYEKSFILEGLVKEGIAVLYKDHDQFSYLLDRCKFFNVNTTLTYSHSEKGTWQLTQCEENLPALPNQIFAVSADNKSVNYHLSIPGIHSAINSLGAFTLCVEALGLPVEEVTKGLSSFQGIKGRSAIYKVNLSSGSITLIDDAYNANPTSMKAGLRVLSNFKISSTGGRRIAVIGDMKELGHHSKNYHEEIGLFINSLPLDKVFTYGEEMTACSQVLTLPNKHYSQLSSLKEELIADLQDDDIVFVKGSKSTLISYLVDDILSLDDPKELLKTWA